MARPKQFDREVALEAAKHVFWDKGFSATSTDDLRLAMGIGRQSFYDTFKGKKETYLEVLHSYNTSRFHFILKIFRQSDQSIEALENLLLSIALETPKQREMGCMGIASVCEFGTTDAEVLSINTHTAKAIHAELEKIVKEAQSAKTIRKSLNPSTTAAFLQSTLSGLRVSARGGMSPKELKEIARMAIEGLA